MVVTSRRYAFIKSLFPIPVMDGPIALRTSHPRHAGWILYDIETEKRTKVPAMRRSGTHRLSLAPPLQLRHDLQFVYEDPFRENPSLMQMGMRYPHESHPHPGGGTE